MFYLYFPNQIKFDLKSIHEELILFLKVGHSPSKKIFLIYFDDR